MGGPARQAALYIQTGLEETGTRRYPSHLLLKLGILIRCFQCVLLYSPCLPKSNTIIKIGNTPRACSWTLKNAVFR